MGQYVDSLDAQCAQPPPFESRHVVAVCIATEAFVSDRSLSYDQSFFLEPELGLNCFVVESHKQPREYKALDWRDVTATAYGSLTQRI